jgi:hypothetical protein
MDIFKKLKELDLPFGHYVIIGSGILAALGLRPANDLDIAVDNYLLEKLKSSPDFREKNKYSKLFLESEDVEIITELQWEHYPTTIEQAIKSAEIIMTYPFLNLDETIKFKKALGREKDFQ